MATAGTLVQDPQTGAYTLAPGSDQSPVPGSASLGSLGLPSGAGGTPQMNAMGTGTAPGSDPYSIFINNISQMLTKAQAANTTAQTNLGGAANTLTTESVAPGGPTSFNPDIGSNSQVEGQETLQAGFAPAITSLNTQMQNENTATENIIDMAGKDMAYFQPQALSPGQSLVSPDGSIILNGVSYSAQVNPQTGSLTLLPTNSLGGNSSGSGSGISGTTPQTTSTQTGTAGVVGGVDLNGDLVGMQPYATDPNYVQEIQGTYKAIQASLPTPALTTVGVNDYIDSVAPKSGVTGQMILNAAHTYNVDPYLLLAIAQHESDFGTQGAATTTNNPFNVGNTGTSTQQYGSISAGVMAGAAALAKRMPTAAQMSATPATPGSTGVSQVGGTFSPTYAAKVSKLPANVQTYAQAGPAGVAYIDGTRVPDSMQTAVQTEAAAAGIPYLAAGDVAAMQSIVQAQQNLNLMETTAKTTLGNGLGGFLKDAGATAINDLPMVNGNAFPNFNQFNSYATEAINLIRGLAGGAGSGLRMTQSEINTAQQNIPTSGDTLANALKKVQVLQGLVYTRISSVFPDAQVLMVNTDGQQGYVPASQYSDAINEGYNTP